MKDYRPSYHYRPKENWINDPCGLTQLDGVYHLYHQYNPHGDSWGDMHWGHAVSCDMVDWQEQPIAMAPAENLGEDHCFTGCCGRLGNGSPVFYYTSISSQRESEQWLAYPVQGDVGRLQQTRKGAMTLAMHPAGMKISEWRDPSVTPYKDGWLMVLGCRLGDRGAALLYTSRDGQQFTYHSVLAQSDGSEDYSWECPNFFPLGDKYVLFYSPYRQPRYLVGTLTGDLRFVVEGRGVLDESGQEGAYAPQAFADEQGRRLLFNWLTERSRGDWQGPSGWAGCMSLPREVFLEDGVIRQRIIPEVEKLVVREESFSLPLARIEAGEACRLVVEGTVQPQGSIVAHVLQTVSGDEETIIRVHGNGRLVVDRSRSSHHPAHRSLLERRISLPGGRLRLEIYVDHSVLEVGGNGEWISTRVYPAGDDCTGLTVTAQQAQAACRVAQLRPCAK